MAATVDLSPLRLEERAAPPLAKPSQGRRDAGSPQAPGDNSERVIHLQNRLTQLGHPALADGVFGPKTDEQVRAFQGKHGLTPDGVVGPKTTEALRSPPDPAEFGDGGGLDAGEVAATAELANDDIGDGTDGADPADFQPGPALHKGVGVGEQEGNEDVKALQGALGVATDGRFGPETHGAVKKFQRKMGLNPDGIVGDKTQRALVGSKAAEAQKAAAKPVAKKVAKPASKQPQLTEANDPGGLIRRAFAELEEGKLSAADRKALPKGAYVFPDRAPHSGAYPIHDEGHARAALARVKQHGSPDEQAKVKAAVSRRYPKLQEAQVETYTDEQLSEAVEALTAEELAEAADSMRKANTPEPFSTSKTSNWVARGGGLPPYIQHIAHDIAEKRGKSVSNAIAIAIGVVKRWARGGGSVDSGTRAAASKALAQWEKLKAGNAAKKEAKKLTEATEPPSHLVSRALREIEEAWSPKAREAALAARRAHSGGNALPPLHSVKSMGKDDRNKHVADVISSRGVGGLSPDDAEHLMKHMVKPAEADTTVHTTTGDAKNRMMRTGHSFAQGKTVAFEGHQSGSESATVAKQFAGGSKEHVHIEVPKGTPVYRPSEHNDMFRNEREVVLPHGTRVQVHKSETKDGVTHHYGKVVGPAGVGEKAKKKAKGAVNKVAKKVAKLTEAEMRDATLLRALREAGYEIEEAKREGKMKCPKCDHMVPGGAAKCPNCDHDMSKARSALGGKLSEAQTRADTPGFTSAERVRLGQARARVASLGTSPERRAAQSEVDKLEAERRKRAQQEAPARI